eukprot:1160748-Pelagomonas_calceolata.AAC.9
MPATIHPQHPCQPFSRIACMCSFSNNLCRRLHAALSSYCHTLEASPSAHRLLLRHTRARTHMHVHKHTHIRPSPAALAVHFHNTGSCLLLCTTAGALAAGVSFAWLPAPLVAACGLALFFDEAGGLREYIVFVLGAFLTAIQLCCRCIGAQLCDSPPFSQPRAVQVRLTAHYCSLRAAHCSLLPKVLRLLTAPSPWYPTPLEVNQVHPCANTPSPLASWHACGCRCLVCKQPVLVPGHRNQWPAFTHGVQAGPGSPPACPHGSRPHVFRSPAQRAGGTADPPGPDVLGASFCALIEGQRCCCIVLAGDVRCPTGLALQDQHRVLELMASWNRNSPGCSKQAPTPFTQPKPACSRARTHATLWPLIGHP